MVTGTTTADAESARRSEVERLLDEYNINWRYDPALPMDKVNEKASYGNQARIDQPILDDLLEQYVVARNHGDEFPAIVVQETRSDKPVTIVDGNHRYASGKEVKLTTHPAYVIKAKPEIVRILMTELNVINGRGLSDRERLFHTFFLIDQGTAMEKAAEVMRLPTGKVKTAWALEQANRRASELGVRNKAWNEIPQHGRIRIGQVYTDEAFVPLVRLVTKAGLNGSEISKLVTDVNKSRSTKAQLERIHEEEVFFKDRIQTTGGGRMPFRQSPKNALRMHLAALTKLNLEDIPELATEEEAELLAQWCLDASEALTRLADKLTVAK